MVQGAGPERTSPAAGLVLQCIGGLALGKDGDQHRVWPHVAGLTAVVARVGHRHRVDRQGRPVYILLIRNKR
jgi:hypothetical protein